MTRHLGSGAVEAPFLAFGGRLALIGALALATPALAATSGAAWIVTPANTGCHAELELTGRSGAAVEVTLESDGQQLALRFAKDGVPARAFLPIRVDQKPFANLMQRTDDARSAVMVLSDQTQAALRKGQMLQIAWLTDEPLAGSLAGSEQGIADLKTCGAQVSAQYRDRQAALADQQARAAVDARAKALADEQLAAVRAQTAAADAERQRQTAEAQRAQAQADRLAAETERQRMMADNQQRQAVAAQWQGEPYQRWTPYREPAPYQQRAPYRSRDDDGYGYAPRYGDDRYDDN